MINMAQEVRQQVSLADVLDHYGLRPNRSGFLHCPFHSGDRDASLKIYPAQNSWHCFGCGKGGSVIDFVMEMEKIGFREALVYLDRLYDLRLIPDKLDERQRRQAQKRALERKREQEKAKLRAEEQRRQRLELIEQRRKLWQEYMNIAVIDHNTSQQKSLILAEVERIDYQIEEVSKADE